MWEVKKAFNFVPKSFLQKLVQGRDKSEEKETETLPQVQ